MDLSFKLTEEQEAFRQSVRELVEDKIAPRAAEIDEADEYPWDIDELFVKNGFAGVSYPEEYGGAGGGRRRALPPGRGDLPGLCRRLADPCGQQARSDPGPAGRDRRAEEDGLHRASRTAITACPTA